MSNSINQLLENNKTWSQKVIADNPNFFSDLAKHQNPEYLWIGCADSRVDASEITSMSAGSIFVHRNIANMVVHTDVNMLSVVHYAVKVLKIKHIIVCGHYGCGGVGAAMSNKEYGFLDNWLLNIKDVYRLHKHELDPIEDQEEKLNKYVELNVVEQVHNLSKISFIQDEWEDGNYPYIHGWVYDLKTGQAKDMGISINSSDDLDPIFTYENKDK